MMRPRQFILWGLLMGAVPGCSGTHEQRKEQAVTAPVAASAGQPVLDLPALVGLSIDELSRRLGPGKPLPAGFVDPVTAPLAPGAVQPDSSMLFRAAQLRMVVTFDQHSHRVSDLLLLGADEDTMMQQANLQPNSEKYLILPVYELSRPNQLLGLRVIAKGR
jgi:hypothetical protein